MKDEKLNPNLIKTDTILNRWKKFLLHCSIRSLEEYRMYFSTMIETTVNAKELVRFITELLYTKNSGFFHNPVLPAEFNLRYYQDVDIF